MLLSKEWNGSRFLPKADTWIVLTLNTKHFFVLGEQCFLRQKI